ncbi:uncharacterized protein LOC118436976 [Folsomia candida]|uniref:uncharacterized protein LOC118436976 n=1 Tax=Folsomia candida TaxID=158441 RepID=UPI001604D64C|nr:uncharacterized protein LOC118436976 [Folsomia candida]
MYVFMRLFFLVPVFFLIANELKASSRIKKTERFAIPELRRAAKNIVIEFNSIRILNTGMMQNLGHALVLSNGLFGQYCLFSNFVVIKQWNEMEPYAKTYLILLSIVLQILWGTVLKVSGRIHANVNRVPKSWKYLEFDTPEEKKYLQKVAKSCRKIGIGVDGLFIIKRTSSLKFFRAIVKGTFRALLTIGRK